DRMKFCLRRLCEDEDNETDLVFGGLHEPKRAFATAKKRASLRFDGGDPPAPSNFGGLPGARRLNPCKSDSGIYQIGPRPVSCRMALGKSPLIHQPRTCPGFTSSLSPTSRVVNIFTLFCRWDWRDYSRSYAA